MANNKLRNKTLSGLFWESAQKWLNQGLSFLVTIILARLLLPEDYGAVALAGMFIVLMGVFIDGGLGMSLIQKKDADELDYSNLVMSVVIYCIVFLLAPLVAAFYDTPLLTPLIRVMSLGMPIGALTGVHGALISKRMEFRKFFITSVWRQFLAAGLAIIMAYNGMGPWALVAQSLMATVANSFALYHLCPWRPSLQFSWSRFNQLFSFAWKKQAAGLIGTFCSQLKGYLIGYKYTKADLAFMNRGDGLPDMFMNNINGTINGVLFPALSQLNDDTEAVKRGIRRSMTTSSFVLCPMLFGLAAMADNIVPVLYSERWNPAIPFMQVACFTCCMTVLNTANLQALLAIGRSDEVLKLEFYKKPVMILILFISTLISPIAISIGMFIYSIYVLLMNTIPNKKHLHYSILEQINDVKPAFIMSAVMASAVYLLGFLGINIYLLMATQVVMGVIIYVGLSFIFRVETFFYLKDIILGIYKKKRDKTSGIVDNNHDTVKSDQESELT